MGIDVRNIKTINWFIYIFKKDSLSRLKTAWTVLRSKNGQFKMVDRTNHDHMLVMINTSFKG